MFIVFEYNQGQSIKSGACLPSEAVSNLLFLNFILSSSGKYSLSWPQKLGPSKVSIGFHVFGSITLPPQPFSIKKPYGVIE